MKPRILIVEDEPAIMDAIQYALETDGFETTCLGAGGEVATVLASQTVDLMVLDIGLPDVNGFDLCREVRKTSAVPIIFLTARSEEIDRVVGLEIGADDYVVKPFSPRELSARVRAVLRRSQGGEPPAEAASSGFVIREGRRQILYSGAVLDLSRTEYEILRTLIRRPGRVYTREQLMDAAWDEPEASMDRTVDAHIKNLRAKLRSVLPDTDPIVTHRGVGYALKEGL
jgi:two-component system catabolic regulation response regulator CreB